LATKILELGERIKSLALIPSSGGAFEVRANGKMLHSKLESGEWPDFDAIAAQVPDMNRTIFNFHAPPYGTGLDEAPALDAELRPMHGGAVMKPVGSTAVREVIEEHQPALSLHGHIHEARGNARIGRTLCINPGSSYEQGDLLGAVIDLDGKKKVKRFLLTSG